jgi:hypothetical protein
VNTPAGTPKSPGAASVRAPRQRTAERTPGRPADDDLWRAYELAQRHYEHDLQLFSARMNLFLVIQSGLVALAGVEVRAGDSKLLAGAPAVASLGLALALGWLLVAASSYLWVKTWRAHMIELGDRIRQETHIDVSGAVFERERRRDSYRKAYGSERLWRQLELFSWFVRPTLVTCCLPLVFIAGWIYIGWFL